MKDVTDFVFEKRKKAVTDSLIVSEYFRKSHRHVLRNIDNLTAQNWAVKKMFREVYFINNRGREYRKFEMTRDGFSILVMGFTGREALNFKISFIEAFNKMEDFIRQRVSVDWEQARLEGKAKRTELTDTLRAFVEYAKAQGSSSPEKYYIHVTKCTYKALKFLEKAEKLTNNIRDLLDTMDLAFLGVAEQVARSALDEGMDENLHYKDIYELAKKKLIAFGSTVEPINIKRKQLPKK